MGHKFNQFNFLSRLMEATQLKDVIKKESTRKHGYEWYKSIGSPKYVVAPMVD